MASESIFTIAFTLFFTLNLSATPYFHRHSEGIQPEKQTTILLRENCIALVLMLLFGFFGKFILSAIGINHNVINIGGGVILFLIALNMIFPKHIPPGTPVSKKEPFIVPLATPLIAGGGTLAAVMMFGFRSTNHWILLGGIVIAWMVNSIILLLAPLIKKVVKEMILDALERLMGLVLTLIASQMIVGGILSFVTTKLAEPATPPPTAAISAPAEMESVRNVE